MKKILFSVICLILTNTGFAGDSLEVRIRLKSIGDILTFNQDSVPMNSQEYAWMVVIDSDNNPNTGNTVGFNGNSGFDVGFSVSHFKASSVLQTGSMVSMHTQKNTVLLSGNLTTSAHGIVAYLDYSDTSLVMKASKAHAEIAAIQPGQRFMAYATYYKNGLISDVSTVANIPSYSTDVLNDINKGYVDIRGALVDITTGIKDNYSYNTSVRLVPNPSAGIFTIQGNVESAPIKVYNILGDEIIFEQRANEINITDSPKGVYFVQFKSGERSFTKRIVKE